MYDAVIDEVDGRRIRIGREWFVDFASCNYLGFDLEPEIIAAIERELRRWGTHPSWSRLLGSPRLYPEIEQRLADLLGVSDTLVLPTITHIHMSAIPALVGTGQAFVDRSAHKTIFDGCRYAGGLGATVHRFAGLEQLHNLLRAAGGGRRLVCVDGVNSMTGNLPDLAELLSVCRGHGAVLYVDDAHGFGIVGERDVTETCDYGRRGNSIVRHLGECYDDLVLVGGFSKAYSALLAFIALPTDLKNYLKIAAPPYLYSGPSPVASLAGVLAGFEINDARGDMLRQHLHRLTARVLDHARNLGVATPNTSGIPIIEFPIVPGEDLTRVADELWTRGIYATLAAYPLVPRAEAGFRVQLTAAHTDRDIDALNAAIGALAVNGMLRVARPGPAGSGTRAGLSGAVRPGEPCRCTRSPAAPDRHRSG
ncbi:MAG: pyridoxal phosphate-dependent aminotransferase family protein [Dactylosporangium sp.]|nr:pyridoxal phosphate-dependent aminotransferase family protein [Dactylosporangium sp.]NNJ61010.1 pyridoxal phosphate-dependent aminotransferase family protein [Dactylosporangium sp.]